MTVPTEQAVYEFSGAAPTAGEERHLEVRMRAPTSQVFMGFGVAAATRSPEPDPGCILIEADAGVAPVVHVGEPIVATIAAGSVVRRLARLDGWVLAELEPGHTGYLEPSIALTPASNCPQNVRVQPRWMLRAPTVELEAVPGEAQGPKVRVRGTALHEALVSEIIIWERSGRDPEHLRKRYYAGNSAREARVGFDTEVELFEGWNEITIEVRRGSLEWVTRRRYVYRLPSGPAPSPSASLPDIIGP